ncbi:MAG: hypothetical protein HOC91_13065 [Nitrospinaceae bacterium]|nr:hypothetical protein [Nitrospinaceae bacterium]MBT4431440.1 hypothetical protein [Nitrospinaceae bacterium]MBT5947861.1 hypothetical protein [Nitrospinaceae bacterium]MBT6395820.1 hypothetical protein [Nitrospinaceae bacterium]MBT7858164.1 hypothetical protein [Nitrospinaceae bacterium]
MNQPSPESWDELLALLNEQIEEREVARADIEKSIQILKDAERELRQKHFSPPRQDDEQQDHLPYRISTSPLGGDMPEGPEAHKALEPINELDEISLLRKNDAPAPPTESAMDIDEKPRLLSNPPTPPTSPDAGDTLPGKVDEALQDEQIFLLGGKRIPGRAPLDFQKQAAKDNPKPEFLKATEGDLDLDVPQPVFTKPHSNGEHTNGGHSNGGSKPSAPNPVLKKPTVPLLSKELPAALDQLMHFIRGGGAIRCQDPWGQNCAAFLLTSNNTSVAATDVFLNYLRKSIQQMKSLHDESSMMGTATSRNTERYTELETRKHFLATLVKEMLKQSLSSLVEVSGLRITGQETPPDKFDFENSTKDFLHPGFLNALVGLLGNSTDMFFLAGGPYFEIADFLGQYKTFSRETGEEALAAAMLVQLGQRATKEPALAPEPPAPPVPALGSPVPPSVQPPTPKPSIPTPPEESEAVELMLEDEVLELDDPEEPEKPVIELPDPDIDTQSFMEESDNLQDLNTFDFDPSDKKSIMAQKEDALSMSKFKVGKEKKIKPPASTSLDEESLSSSSAGSAPETSFSIGDISPANGPEVPLEQEFKLNPETEGNDTESFSLDDLENLLDKEN